MNTIKYNDVFLVDSTLQLIEQFGLMKLQLMFIKEHCHSDLNTIYLSSSFNAAKPLQIFHIYSLKNFIILNQTFLDVFLYQVIPDIYLSGHHRQALLISTLFLFWATINLMHLDLIDKQHKKSRPRGDASIINYIRQQRFNNRYSLTDRASHYDALGDPYTSYYFSNRSVKEHLKKFRRAIMDQPNLTQKKRINKLVTLRIKESFKDYICPKTLVYQKEMTNLQLDILGKRSAGSLNTIKSKQSLNSNSTQQDNLHVITRSKGYLAKMQPLNNSTNWHIDNNHQQSLRAQVTDKQLPEEIPLPPQNKQIIKTNQVGSLILKRKKRQTTSKIHLAPQTEQSAELPSRNKTLNKQSTEQKLFADRLAEELHQKKHQKWLQYLQAKKRMLQQAQSGQNSPTNVQTNPETNN